MSEKITWGDVHDLASAVDAAADDLSVDGYTPLLTDNTTPFPLDAVVPATFQYHFDTYEGPVYPIIVSQFISGSSFTAPLDTLAQHGELYFAIDKEQDDCWCSVVFKVARDGSVYKLDVVDYPFAGSCSPSLAVPANGDALDNDQKFIPSGWSEFYNKGTDVTSMEPTQTREEQMCVADAGTGAKFLFKKGYGNHYDLVACERKMTGTFVWPIRTQWFDAIVDRITFIANGSCGAFDSTIYKSGSTTDYIIEGCFPTFDDLQQTLKMNGGGEVPGCMTAPGAMPWESPTCGGGYCDNGSVSVYKSTLNQLRQIADDLASQLYAFKDTCDFECNNCNTLDPSDNTFNITSKEYFDYLRGGVWTIYVDGVVVESCGDPSDHKAAGFGSGGTSSGSFSLYGANTINGSGCGHSGKVVLKGSSKYSYNDGTSSGTISTTDAAYFTANLGVSSSGDFVISFELLTSSFQTANGTTPAGLYPASGQAHCKADGMMLNMVGVWLPGWAGYPSYANGTTLNFTATFTPSP